MQLFIAGLGVLALGAARVGAVDHKFRVDRMDTFCPEKDIQKLAADLKSHTSPVRGIPGLEKTKTRHLRDLTQHTKPQEGCIILRSQVDGTAGDDGTVQLPTNVKQFLEDSSGSEVEIFRGLINTIDDLKDLLPFHAVFNGEKVRILPDANETRIGNRATSSSVFERSGIRQSAERPPAASRLAKPMTQQMVEEAEPAEEAETPAKPKLRRTLTMGSSSSRKSDRRPVQRSVSRLKAEED